MSPALEYALSPADLRTVGQALYGRGWRKGIAIGLGIPYTTLVNWLAKGRGLPLEYVYPLAVLAADRRDMLARLHIRLIRRQRPL